MKKQIFILVIILLILADTKGQVIKNEFKANFAGLAYGLPDIAYERLVNNHSGLGIAVGAGINRNKGSERFFIVPYYRYYLGKKLTQGFFVEVNAVALSKKVSLPSLQKDLEKFGTYYGAGLALGAKIIFRKNYLIEGFLGAGKLFNLPSIKNGPTNLGIYPRLGISLGKQL